MAQDPTNSMIFFKGLSIISENISKPGEDGKSLDEQLGNAVWGGLGDLGGYYRFGLDGSVLTNIAAVSIGLFITRNKDKIPNTDNFIESVFKGFNGKNITINNGLIKKRNVISLIKKQMGQIDIPETCSSFCNSNSADQRHLVIALVLIISSFFMYFIYKKSHKK